MSEHQHQALTNLIALKKINIFESFGCDAIPGAGNVNLKIYYAMSREQLESQISEAILNNDKTKLGEIMMKLFMDYNADIIAQKAQELQGEAMQEQDDLNGKMSVSELARKHYENGVSPGDFF
jgi:hypothetical protein